MRACVRACELLALTHARASILLSALCSRTRVRAWNRRGPVCPGTLLQTRTRTHTRIHTHTLSLSLSHTHTHTHTHTHADRDYYEHKNRFKKAEQMERRRKEIQKDQQVTLLSLSRSLPPSLAPSLALPLLSSLVLVLSPGLSRSFARSIDRSVGWPVSDTVFPTALE